MPHGALSFRMVQYIYVPWLKFYKISIPGVIIFEELANLLCRTRKTDLHQSGLHDES